ncbi:MAG: hypothetical protein OXI81_20390 [Paracoccaceae bacterium]|nr:hypothetical protein [Paracoccaceae bacterium]
MTRRTRSDRVPDNRKAQADMDRRDRLKQSLRDNLKRRKQQSRRRQAGATMAQGEDGPGPGCAERSGAGDGSGVADSSEIER